ncbi:tRNA (adenine(22)-N(1))-methyltransferase [Anaerobacillus sp. MEB173]|uniref:tRNA (adenine(22)-N(1))-methyltransferase n=1 Tax=Anaerobacillus sp. MEB173 TaxID=3383345 RepID=UPI003F8FAD70
MNELKLSERLNSVVEKIPAGAFIADIGSDHAYLPCYAYLQGKIRGGIAGEVNDGPFQSAISQVKKSGLEQVISVRKGNGLEVIEKAEADTITICGMGGSLITQILEEGKGKLEGVQRLVLQPNVAADTIRVWLKDHDWELLSEDILEEDGKVYEILVAEPGQGGRPYSDQIRVELLLGPYLMKKKSDAFRKKWMLEVKNWNRVLQQLDNANQTDELIQRKEDLRKRINQVEEVLSDE